MVTMNAYLPSLAKASPEVVQILVEIQNAQDSEVSPSLDVDPSEGAQLETSNAIDEPLIHPIPSYEINVLRKRYDNELSRATSRISSLGIALGYGAGICLLIVALIPVTKLHGSTFALRLAIGLSGIWWAVFSIPAAIWLPGAGSPGITATNENAVWIDDSEVTGRKWDVRQEIIAAWKRLGGMLRWGEIKRLRNTFKYLAAWFLLSDGWCNRCM